MNHIVIPPTRPLQSAPEPVRARHPTLTQRHADANRLTEALIALQNSAPPSTEAPLHVLHSSFVFHAFTVALQTTASGSTVGCKRARAEAARRWLTGRVPHSQSSTLLPLSMPHGIQIASRIRDRPFREIVRDRSKVRRLVVGEHMRLIPPSSEISRRSSRCALADSISQIRSRRFDLA